MLQMKWIRQCNQYTYIQQKPAHINSSMSCRTNSVVAGVAPGCIGSNGIPFLVLCMGRSDFNAFRASEEITDPKLFCCASASCLAAISTSSSIASVVRMIAPSGHHEPITLHSSSTMDAVMRGALDDLRGNG